MLNLDKNIIFCDDNHKMNRNQYPKFVIIKNSIMENTANNPVKQFIQYLNEENFDKAETCLDPEFKFKGVMGSRENAAVYIKDMKQMKFKYKIQKLFTANEDVCLWYDIDMGEKTITACGWYRVADGKIKSLEVLFDPRPLLDHQK
ncbi:hypothetical protein CHFL109739_04455 [Chryseobacterium flavum]